MIYGVAASFTNVIPFPVRPDPEPEDDGPDPEPASSQPDERADRVDLSSTCDDLPQAA